MTAQSLQSAQALSIEINTISVILAGLSKPATSMPIRIADGGIQVFNGKNYSVFYCEDLVTEFIDKVTSRAKSELKKKKYRLRKL